MSGTVPAVSEFVMDELLDAMQMQGTGFWDRLEQMKKEDPIVAKFINGWLKDLPFNKEKEIGMALIGPMMVYLLLTNQFALHIANNKLDFKEDALEAP